MIRVNIALAANAPYFPGLFVTACSIAMYAANNSCLNFYILDGGIETDNFNLLESALKRLHANTTIYKIIISENDVRFSRFQRWHGNTLAYARLLLPELLPSEDFIIYCDVDFLWMRDITELWNMRRDNISFIGVKDPGYFSMLQERDWYKRHGYEFDRENYFCSGLSFLNLKYFRIHRFSEKCFEFLAKYDDLNFPDQTALNVVTYGTTLLVDPCWMIFSYALKLSDCRNGCVIHYVNATPWTKRAVTRVFRFVNIVPDTSLIWYKLYAKARDESLLKSIARFIRFDKYLRGRIAFNILASRIVKMTLSLFASLNICRVGIKYYLGFLNKTRLARI